MDRLNTKLGTIGKALLLCIGFMLLGQALWAAQIAKVVSDQPSPKQPLISVNFYQKSLPKVLAAITQKAHVGLSYKTKAVPPKRITYRAKNAPIYSVLDAVLKGTDLYYELSKNRKVVLIKQMHLKIVKQQTVSGTVTDAQTGDPLAGVNILVVGTSTGTATDANGHYSVSVPSLQDSLRFSYIGYQTQTVPINGRGGINVEMQSQIISGKEVVVTALGINRQKRSLSYSSSTVSGKEVSTVPVANLGSSLNGKIPGVSVSGSSGGIGSSSRVIIRGNTSLTGENQPLYVVDGVPINSSNRGTPGTFGGQDLGNGLDAFNPEDIKSIQVLKGGAAAALYGSRASNGVILITTKSGNTQKGFGVTYNTALTFNTVKNLSSKNGWQYKYGSGVHGKPPQTQQQAIQDGRMSWGAPLNGSEVIQPDGVVRPYIAQRNNVKEFYNTGIKYLNSLSVDGGNEKIHFRLSGSNLNNKGLVPNVSMKRKTFNLNVNGSPNDKIEFSGVAQYSHTENFNRTWYGDFTNNPNAAIGVMATSLNVRTLAPGYDSQGNEVPWNDYVYVVNPYFAVNKIKNRDINGRLIGHLQLRYNITDYLYLRARVSLDHISMHRKNITPTGILHQPAGSLTQGQRIKYERNGQALLGFKKDFRDFSSNIIIGGNLMQKGVNGIDLSSGPLNTPYVYFIANGSSPSINKIYSKSSINSLFYSATFGYKDALFLSTTGREDWFSTLPITNNHIFYPSAGLSYAFTSFWKAKPLWLDFGKIRLNWAQVGGGAPQPYGLTLTYNAAPITILGQQSINISGSQVPNDQLRPYTTTSWNVGLDARILNNRLGIDISLYQKITNNDIVSIPIAPASGYSTLLTNVGEVKNKGIDLKLDATPVRVNEFRWDSDVNLAYNHNRVVRISKDLKSIEVAEPRTQNGFIYNFEGKPYGMVAGFTPKHDTDGNIVYNANNGLPVQGELKPLGRGVAPLSASFINTFRYKNLSMNIMLRGKFGRYMYLSREAEATYYGKTRRTAKNNVRENGVHVNGVDRQGNPFSTTVDAQTYYQYIAFRITSDFVKNASFIKLQQASIGYTLPQKLISKTSLQSVKISFIGDNLLTLYSPIRSIDPESSEGTTGHHGLEFYGVPTSRAFGFKVSVSY